METRKFRDSEDQEWEAFAADTIVAHGKQGAVLAFRPVSCGPDDVLKSTITFNSMAAADFALRTLGEKDLRRRLSLARMAVGGV